MQAGSYQKILHDFQFGCSHQDKYKFQLLMLLNRVPEGIDPMLTCLETHIYQVNQIFRSEGGSLVVYHQLSCQNWSFHGINDPFKGRHCRHGGLSRSDNCRQWEIRWTTSWALSPLQPSRQSGNALIVKPLWTFNFRASATILVSWHPGTKLTSEL